MSIKIFLTGSTGYVGGALLHVLISRMTDCTITSLVRTTEQATLLESTYPGIKTTIGTLESRDLLISEASKSDIVIHAANVDHVSGTLSLLDGLKSHHSEGRSALYILVSGTGSLPDETVKPGQPMPRVFDDVINAEEIWNLPRDRSHVAIERRFVEEGEAANVRTVVVSPGQIFHTGVGVGKKESYLNEHPRAMFQHGGAFVVKEGLNTWCWVSVEDLAEGICLLARRHLDQLAAGEKDFGPGYGRDGYYFAQAGELSVTEQAEVIADELFKLGAIKSTDIDHIDEEHAKRLHGWGVLLWGSSMRAHAQKLRDLGWTPTTTDWKALVRRAARAEWEALQAGQVKPVTGYSQWE
ncbi:hypothetical protein LTR84_005471 [Exophiala bonariae]|uniref:NAD-dependent epimerase/dehydratase domain-containing protein n=1 Tax=Exophiala bonariae TaxID=1690606 RepID=A0AAV9N655_9EURO|nr:hypothetical protein LTR84_005471 [Exophiala bonariae]